MRGMRERGKKVEEVEMSEKDGEIKFLKSKITQLNETIDKLKNERDELQKANNKLNMSIGLEVMNLVEELCVPVLGKGSKVLIEDPLREMVTKYDSSLSYVGD